MLSRISLRLGFRFLRSLINHYHGDIRLALLAYNRGPNRVDQLLAAGIDPAEAAQLEGAFDTKEAGMEWVRDRWSPPDGRPKAGWPETD